MLSSIIFVVLFLICLAGVVWCPKTEGRINAVKALVMGTFAIFCYQAFFAFLYNKLGIPVNLTSTSCSMLAADLLLWGFIIKKRKLQKVFFRMFDIVCLILLAAFVIGIAMHLFTPRLRLSYLNSDAANHFKKAMAIVKTGTLEDIYFSAFVDAMVIEIFSPVLALVKYYKAFIVADIFMHILEIWMFYVAAITISGKKLGRAIAPIFSVAYFFGYPAYSFMTGNFVYWSTGVMILIFLAYALLLLERYPKMLPTTGSLLLLGAYANSCCNRLFIPVNYIVLFAAVIVVAVQWKKTGRIPGKAFWGAFAAMLVAAAGIAVFFFFRFQNWSGSYAKLMESLLQPGGIYRSMYVDLIFFLPAFFFVCYYAFFKRGHSKLLAVMSVAMLIITIAIYIVWYNYLISTYYYYKIYYNLWLFGWLLAAMAVGIMIETKQLPAFFSYFGMILMLAVITLTNYDINMWNHNISYNENNVPKNVFYLYRFNMDSLLEDYETYEIPAKIMDVFAYGTERLDDKLIVSMTSNDVYKYWFDGMRVQNSKPYAVDQRELMETLRILDKKKISKIMVIKGDGYYEQYEDYFQYCKVVYENDEAAILTYPGDGWCKIFKQVEGYSKEKKKLFRYVKKNLKDVRVPLMAEKSGCLDYVTYTKLTGQNSTDCYPWNYNPKEYLERLNVLGVKYALLLYDDPFYEDWQYYFDSQETVYETSAGKIVTCAGDHWTTEYR